MFKAGTVTTYLMTNAVELTENSATIKIKKVEVAINQHENHLIWMLRKQ